MGSYTLFLGLVVFLLVSLAFFMVVGTVHL